MKYEDFIVDCLGTPTLKSPLSSVDFVSEDRRVIYENDPDLIKTLAQGDEKMLSFEQAGPREKIFHDPSWSKAAVLTAGGLCPGLNDVIKFLTRTLRMQYGVKTVYGIRYGYRGLVPEYKFEPLMLDDDNVDAIHENGGTILSSSRGRQDEVTMVDTMSRMGINMLFCIGGDGTLRCAHDVAMEIKRRGLAISVVGIPKTIDNDIGFLDKSFGFESAVYSTTPFVTAAHNEARGAYNGIGLIKVMGRDSGFIAAYSTLANSHVNICLIPEKPFSLDANNASSLLPLLEERLRTKKHAVIMVAEGAGQDLFAKHSGRLDASGNQLHDDIGLLLKEKIEEYFKQRDIEINLKYFDPSYTIRSGPAHGTDAVFCTILAQNAVHAAMAGRTDIVVGHWHDHFTHVPIALATRRRKKIDLKGQLWTSVMSTTLQCE